jgi:uncharacterized protein YdiU (UPF0061 family)
MDAYDPATVFSSIDHGGRYAYGNQPAIAQWNLARLAEALLPLIDDDAEAAVAAATDVLQRFPDRFGEAWRAGMRAKLGLEQPAPDDDALFDALLALMHAQRADHTSTYRALATALRSDSSPLHALFADDIGGIDAWVTTWRERVADNARDLYATAAAMDRVNPRYIARNHLVDAALAAATAGDLGPVRALLDVLADPFTERPGLDSYASPAPHDFARGFRTFCGT